ncbi:MAG: zf-TFIIB domain-containing protein [Methylococcales bacterium]|nr:zf-TFIIB domain-containing protein [Methylococcales bacterium]
MAICSCCSAPLLANTNICRYCNVRNDVDFRGQHSHSTSTTPSDRICPHCHITLETVTLNLKEPFYIERCTTCFGLFFDTGQVNILLASSVSNILDINQPLLKSIRKERYKKKKDFKYIKCPVCQVFMNRVNFSRTSGVVIDHCRKHGIWTDSGEITQLMEWKKAGGQILAEKQEEQKSTKKKRSAPPPIGHSPYYGHTELIRVEWLVSLLNKLF